MNNNKAAAAVGRGRIAAAAVILAALAVASPTLGQQAESVIVDVGACVKLSSPGERLDCYEEEVQRAQARAPVSPAPPAPVPPAVAPSAAAAPPVAAPVTAPPATAPPAPAPQAVAAPAPAAPTASPGAPAGERRVRVESARVRRGESSRESSGESDTFEGVITALRETVPNAWVVTLDNGQVWRQDYPERYRLQVGQPVRIARARGFGGGFRLTVAELGGSIQVERVR